jgi:hypothetical protein
VLPPKTGAATDRESGKTKCRILEPESQDRIIVRTPRGYLEISDLTPVGGDSWSVKIDHYGDDGTWIHSTHFHASYERAWRSPGGWRTQCGKLQLPPGDWSYGKTALELAMEIRLSDAADPKRVLAQFKTVGPQICFVAAGDPVLEVPLDAAGTLARATADLRDLLAELDDLVGQERFTLVLSAVERYRDLETRTLLVATRHLGVNHPLVDVLKASATNASSLETIADVKTSARSLGSTLSAILGEVRQTLSMSAINLEIEKPIREAQSLSDEDLKRALVEVRRRREEIILRRGQDVAMVGQVHSGVAAEYEVQLRRCDQEENDLLREQERRSRRPAHWLPIVGFSLGVLGLVYLLVVASVNPRPTSFAWQIYKPVLALMGAAFALAITGFLLVKLKLGQWWMTAGGPLAVFLILFFAIAPPLPSEPQQESRRATVRDLTQRELRFLRAISTIQRELGVSKLIMGRDGNVLFYGDSPRPTGHSLREEFPDLASLVETMPREYLQLFPETRFDSPFVITVTHEGEAAALSEGHHP